MWEFFMRYLVFSYGFWAVYCEDVGYFWHITDIHVDQNYSRTGNVKNLCHEDLNSLQSATNNVSDNGLFGNFLCDSPQYLVNATVLSMKYIQPSPDFIIWTGDNLPHTDDFDPGWDITFEAIRNNTLLLTSTFPGVSILPSIGNHDSFPPNILPIDNTSSNIYKGYLEKARWKDLINENEWSTFLQGGYYSRLVNPGLRIISLNTILWYEPNNLTSNIDDPGNQFQWLEGVLKNSSKFSEKVYIIGHVPPGFYNRHFPGQEKCSSTFHLLHLKSFLNILNKYSQVIVGQLYGHLHVDMFQVYQYNTGVFRGSSLLASSVSPWHSERPANVSLAVNPSVRLIHYSRTDARLLEFDQYYLNLTKANNMAKAPEEKNVYELLYSFAKYYGVPDLSTESLVQVYEILKRNETIFDSFFTFLSAGERTVDCDKDCKVTQICSISCSSSQEYDMCFKSSDYNCSITPKPSPTSKVSVVIYVALCFAAVAIILILFVVIRKLWIPSDRSEYSRFLSL